MTKPLETTPTAYDDQNVFARVLRKEIAADIVFENEGALAFKDIAPQAPVHVLVIPKGPYNALTTFLTEASPQEITFFWQAIHETIALFSLDKGLRLIINDGHDGGQEVPHVHAHILGGRHLGPLLSDPA